MQKADEERGMNSQDTENFKCQVSETEKEFGTL